MKIFSTKVQVGSWWSLFTDCWQRRRFLLVSTAHPVFVSVIADMARGVKERFNVAADQRWDGKTIFRNWMVETKAVNSYYR